MNLVKLFLSLFLISSTTFSMDEPQKSSDQKYTMRMVSLFDRGCSCSAPEGKVESRDFDSSSVPGPHFRFVPNAYVNVQMDGNHCVLVENLTHRDSYLVPRRLLFSERLVLNSQGQQEQSQQDPSSILLEGGLHLYGGKGQALEDRTDVDPKYHNIPILASTYRKETIHELYGLPLEFLGSKAFRDQFRALPASFFSDATKISQEPVTNSERSNQCPMTAWSLEKGPFDVVLDEREADGLIAHRDGANFLMKGHSRIELSRSGVIILKQSAGSNLVMHIPMGSFDELRGAWANQMLLRPHHASYVTQSKIRLGLTSDGTTLSIDQRLYLPHLEDVHPNHPRLLEGLKVSATSGTKQMNVGQKIVIGKGAGLQIKRGESTLESYGLSLDPSRYRAAEIPQVLKGKIFPVMGTWGYFCNGQALANAASTAFGPVSGGISFYYQNIDGAWRVWNTGETMYDLQPPKTANVAHSVWSGMQMFRVVDEEMNDRLEEARLSQKFLPLESALLQAA